MLSIINRICRVFFLVIISLSPIISAADIKQKISELNGLANEIKDGAQKREGALQDALVVSEKFYDLCGEVMSDLRDLKDNILSQEPPGVDPQTVKEQQKELKVQTLMNMPFSYPCKKHVKEYWNQPVCLFVCVSVCPSMYKILVSVEVLTLVFSLIL